MNRQPNHKECVKVSYINGPPFLEGSPRAHWVELLFALLDLSLGHDL